MRVLCTAIPSAGHVNPLLPLARELADAGHEVTLASGSAAATAAQRAGIRFVEAGISEPEMVAEAARHLPGVAPTRRGIPMFATIAAPALLRDLLPRLDALAPDLIVNEEAEWAGPILAATAAVPAATHAWGAPLWTDDQLEAIAAATAPLWREHAVRPTSPAGLFDSLYIDPCPPVVQDHRAADVGTRRAVRFEPFDSGEAPPRWLTARRTRPLVYATLGTVPTFNAAPQLLATIAHDLGALDLDAVLTVGPNNDPQDLRPLPPNVRAERHLPQVEVLARSSAAITHGGAGSTLAALSFGLPLVVLPRGAPSQQRLALRCAELGAALVLQPEEVRAGAIRPAVGALLEDDRYRASAERIRDSMVAQPTVGALVPELEALAPVAR